MFAAALVGQILGFLILGTGRSGLAVSESLLVVDNLLALVCAVLAFRRAQGTDSMFWLLFAGVLVVLLLPTAIQAHDTILGTVTLSESIRNLLYCLYGAPILMMLFLPDGNRRAHLKSEVYLDLVQIAIVVALVYATFFFLPVQRMLPDEALLRGINLSDAQSLLLPLLALARLACTRNPAARSLWCRLGVFLLVCAAATFTGDWIYKLHHAPAIAWFDLGWAVPLWAASLIAVTWKQPEDAPPDSVPVNFLGFLGTNLALVAMLACVDLLTDHWKQAYGGTLTNLAIAVSLLAFSFRLALTQFHQQQEIARRRAAQEELATSHREVGRLLEEERQRAADIAQISELGSLLQACTSREEVFRLVPERLRRLLRGASGCIAMFSHSRNRVESVAKWGIFPTGQIFSPEECWAIRRGRAHLHTGGESAPRCAHLLGDGDSICIPLVANRETLGTMAVQNDNLLADDPHGGADPSSFAHLRQLALAVAEQIALAIANLNLRDSLRQEAVRDPLTGLYNRRCMEEFLQREFHSARRKHRALAMILLDLDRFKHYNDAHGRLAGDKALAAVGQTLMRCIRGEDVACRFDAEEFVLLLPECSLAQAEVRADEIRKRLKDRLTQGEREDPQVENPSGPLTVSVGVAALDHTVDHVDHLLASAREALIQAKLAGRDRVIAARPAAPVEVARSEKSKHVIEFA